MRTSIATVLALIAVSSPLPVLAQAFPGRITTETNRVTDAPEPLVRLSKDRDCNQYPGSTRRSSGSGSVQLRYTVDASGTVTNVSVTGGSGDELLERGATQCVQSWKFLPLARTGATAPFTAEAMVTYSYVNNGPRRTSTSNWQTPQMKEAANDAGSELTKLAEACLRDAPGIAALAQSANGPTGLHLTFRDGVMRDVLLIQSSGNDVLDKAALACYKGVPPSDERAGMMEKITDMRIPVRWRLLFPASQPAETVAATPVP